MHPSAQRTPFVGRQAEYALLCAALEHARGGAGTLVEITGEPGTGKSRLVEELRATTPEDDPWWFTIAAEPSQRRAPLQLAVDLLLAMLGPSASSPDGAVLAGALRQILPGEDCSALAQALAGYLRPAGPEETMEPALRRRLIAHTLQRVIEALARRRPIALVLDNLHDADTSSLALLAEILPGLAEAPVLLVAIAEPQCIPVWGPDAALTRLVLSGLPLVEAASLIESLAGAPVEADTAGFLNERTGGNPLFLETLMGMLLREGYLESDNGVLRLPLRRYVLIPASPEELYRLQIERLGENVRLALTPAVVIGESFTLRQLSELVRTERTWTVPDTLLTGNLDHLLQCNLIEPQGEAEAYRFRHDLIRVVAAEEAPPLRTSRLHTILGRLLEQEPTPWTARRLQRLAFHFGLGDRATKGIEAHARAGEHALSVQAYPEAEAHYLAGMERLAEAGTGQERPALVESLTAGLARTRAGLQQYEAAEAGFRAALAAADDPLLRATVLDGLAAVLARQWRHQDALFELSQEADLLRVASGEPAMLATLRLQLRRIE
ncbi:MAG TPA: AAA family ATPase, partial [Steroidobacteraceae bacterium]|nr:AAA family ATPase [Steroidobacteraceae bacterium]